MGPPCSVKITRVPTYSSSPTTKPFQVRGYHPLWPDFPDRSPMTSSLDVTGLVPVRSPLLRESQIDFCSYGYLDVSVPRVRPRNLCIQLRVTTLQWPGFPIRTSPDQSLFASSPKLIAGYHVLHRLLPPRHPPYALTRLTI